MIPTDKIEFSLWSESKAHNSLPYDTMGSISFLNRLNDVGILGGLHDLRLDGGLPTGFQKATRFQLPTVAIIPAFMINFGGKLPVFTIFGRFLVYPPMFQENLPKKRPLFREVWTEKPTHMGGTYTYPQLFLLPPPRGVGISSQHLKVLSKRGNIALIALSLRFWAAFVNDPLAEKVTRRLGKVLNHFKG